MPMLKQLTFKVALTYIVGVFLFCFFGWLGFTVASRILPFDNFGQNINLRSSNPDNYFYIDGKAELSAIPDQAEINLGIDVTDDTVAAAQDQVNTILANLNTKLTALGVKEADIQTQNYSVYPNYDWSGEVQNITGYTVSSSVTVDIDNFDILNQAVDAATSVGINQINGINFSLSETKQAELKEEARKIAIDKAKTNAKELASLAGLQLGKIVSISEYEPTNDYPTYRSYDLNMTAGSESADTNIQAGETKYNYQVTLGYQLY